MEGAKEMATNLLMRLNEGNTRYKTHRLKLLVGQNRDLRFNNVKRFINEDCIIIQ